MKIFIKTILLLMLSLWVVPTLGKANGQAETKNTLSFQEVLQRILQQNPRLPIIHYELGAKEGTITQESLRLNPELTIELENLAGSGLYSGLKEMESTIQVGQTIVLGHKRQKKIHAAQLDKTLSLRDRDILLANLMAEAQKRFIALQVLQEKLALRQEMIVLADSFQKKIATRIEAGRTSQAELPQAEMVVLRHQMAFKQLLGDMSMARLRLAVLWGSNHPDFERVEGFTNQELTMPKLEIYQQNMHLNPDLVRLSAETDYKKSLLTVAQAGKIPDLTLNAGFRHLNGPQHTAFTVGASIPMPFFNRNQGEITTASYLLKKAEAEQQVTTLETENEVQALYETLKSTYLTAEMLKTTLLPKAAEAITITTTGYEMGKLSYINVLDALRMQLEVREEYLQTVTLFHQLTTDLERLAGITKTTAPAPEK